MRNYTNTRATVFVGDRFTNRYGCEAEVIKYESAKKVTVRFLDDFGYELVTAVSALKNNSFRNPYYRSVHGVGFLGEGKHRKSGSGADKEIYSRWISMMSRCYEDLPGTRMCYEGCTVDEEWHNFQNFAEWHSKQNIVGSMQIDKDIVCRGNRIYSAQNCRMVPTKINKAMTVSKRGEYPKGVRPHGVRFSSRIMIAQVEYHLGVFDTVEEAFEAYKVAKEAQIISLAEEYKAVLDPEVYESMLNWEIRIED